MARLSYPGYSIVETIKYLKRATNNGEITDLRRDHFYSRCQFSDNSGAANRLYAATAHYQLGVHIRRNGRIMLTDRGIICTTEPLRDVPAYWLRSCFESCALFWELFRVHRLADERSTAKFLLEHRGATADSAVRASKVYVANLRDLSILPDSDPLEEDLLALLGTKQATFSGSSRAPG